jgi:hypothetical protein
VLGVCLLAGGRFRRAALIGTIITVIAQVYLASAFGSAAFVQPGIGRAYLRGETAAAQALNADTAYGPAFMATAGFAVLFWLIGTVFLVVALVRTSPRLRVPPTLNTGHALVAGARGRVSHVSGSTPQGTSFAAPSDRTVDIGRASLVEHLLDCLESGTVPVTSGDRARQVLEIMLAARRSAREARVVELTTTLP